MSTSKQIKFLKYRFDQILSILNSGSVTALDSRLYNFFKQNKKFGSTDRNFISEYLYSYIRHKSYIDTYSKIINKNDSYLKLFLAYILNLNINLNQNQNQNLTTNPKDFNIILENKKMDISIETYPFLDPSSIEEIKKYFFSIILFRFPVELKKFNIPSIIYSLPEWICQKLQASYSNTFEELARSLLQRSSTIIRVNPNKITKSKLIDILDEKRINYQILTEGIRIDEKIHFRSLPEYRSGLIEVQDEGSQLICSKIDILENKKILDYCAGSGGKTLFLASRFKNTKFYCYDIRPQALNELKKRAQRASIKNIYPIYDKNLLPQKIDTLILDVPCSGLGTLRRSPWIKWELSEDKLSKIIKTQHQIITESIKNICSLKSIYYITCSILEEENEMQTKWILNNFKNLKLTQEYKTNPTINPNTDGMYMAEFKVL